MCILSVHTLLKVVGYYDLSVLCQDTVERRSASRHGFRDGCCPPAASHRLCRQLNDKLSACVRCWRFENRLRIMITQQVSRSLALTGDDAGCLSRFGEHERSGHLRQAGTFA